MDRFSKFNTEEEINESKVLLARIYDASEDMDEAKQDWAVCETAYLGEQPVKEGTPGTRVNVILANVEGQAGEMASQDVSVSCIGQSKNDHEFAEDARINLDWDLRHQEDLFGTMLDGARRLLKFGGVWFKTCYDPFAFDEFGVPRVDAPSLDRVIVDPKCVSPRRVQDADFIAEYISMSRVEAEKWYGKAKASEITYGTVNEDNIIFKTELLEERDENGWTMIQVWTKDEGKLRLREYANCGLLLYDSFKGDDRKENQKSQKSVPNSYYTNVGDRYPYVFRTLYPKEGQFYGMGDAKLILKLQDMLNNLYDMIRIGSRPNMIAVDSAANIDIEELGEDSFAPFYFDSTELGVNNRDPVRSVPWAQVNPNWWQLVSAVHTEIQRVLRYSALMMGQTASAQTATEAAIQQQQGTRATNIKQRILEGAMTECVNYMLGLDLQFRTGVKSMRLADDKPEYRDINFDALREIPEMIPTEEGTKKMFEAYGNKPPMKQIKMRKGKPVTKSVALDVKVSIGAGLPKNPAFLADLANKLATTVIMDSKGQARPAMTWEEFRKFARDIMGFPLEDNETIETPPPPPMPNMGSSPDLASMGSNMANPMDANSPLAAGGGVPMAPLAAIRNRTA